MGKFGNSSTKYVYGVAYDKPHTRTDQPIRQQQLLKDIPRGLGVPRVMPCSIIKEAFQTTELTKDIQDASVRIVRQQGRHSRD